MTQRLATRHFVAELYVSRRQAEESLARLRARVRRGVVAATRDGVAVRYVSSTYFPEEEILFVLFGSDSLGGVESALERAGLEHERVHEDVAPDLAASSSLVKQRPKETK